MTADWPTDGAEGDRTPTDPKAGRQARLLVVLRMAVFLVLACALLGAMAPEPWDGRAARATVALLVLFPVGRVGWLGIRWLRKGDIRYATVALMLLIVVGTAAVVAN